jgi:hypothetical protein
MPYQLKGWIRRFIFLLSPFFSLTTHAYVQPEKTVQEYCHNNDCDYQIFYKYFNEHQSRYCKESYSLSRNRKAGDVFRKITTKLQSHNLPLRYAVIPLLESSFNPKARSKGSSAVGLWQLLASTAQDMGLETSADNDERLDVIKSTQAGVSYLEWLMLRYEGDINLSVLSYHMGLGRINKLIKYHGTKNPWFLSRLIDGEPVNQDYLFKFHSYGLVLFEPSVCESKKERYYAHQP